jgi:hypothetical protein
MSARPGLCGGHQATGVPTAIVSHDRFQFFEVPTSIERILLEVQRKWAKLDLSQSVLGMVDRNLPSI